MVTVYTPAIQRGFVLHIIWAGGSLGVTVHGGAVPRGVQVRFRT